MAQSEVSDVTIEEARGLSPGTEVRIKGIVTRANGRFSHLQDGDAAISTFQASGEYNDAIGSGDVAPGDSVIIVGVTDGYNGLFQLTNITSHTVPSRGNPLPDPAEITLDKVGESYESELIVISVDIPDYTDPSESGVKHTLGVLTFRRMLTPPLKKVRYRFRSMLTPLVGRRHPAEFSRPLFVRFWFLW